MSGTTNSVAPQGAGGKSVSYLNPDYDRDMTDNKVNNLANTLAKNLHCSECNLLWAQQRDLNHIEVPDDDKFYIEEPPTPPVTPTPTSSLTKRIAKAYSYVDSLTPTTRKLIYSISGVDKPIPTVPDPCASFVAPSVPSSVSSNTYTFMQSNTRIASFLKFTYEIPCPILNLTKVKVHIPLTVLIPLALHKIHQDPSCIKMMKGLINDPKLSVMDATSSGFPPVTSLPADQFNEAFGNFIKVMCQIADTTIVQYFIDHCAFCTERDNFSENYHTILVFDIKACRKFFNILTFLDRPAYLNHWKEIKINTKLENQSSSSNGSHFQPYLPKKPNHISSGRGTSLNDSNAKPFHKGKGASTDQLLCIICSQLGHRHPSAFPSTLDAARLQGTQMKSYMFAQSVENPLMEPLQKPASDILN
ncbi:hypothetical protein F4604DRAFT_1916018 [Suillus subluteus]|nr:hypothetical protein F4604DRAFT_1916018 [Suillus subluteus]